MSTYVIISIQFEEPLENVNYVDFGIAADPSNFVNDAKLECNIIGFRETRDSKFEYDNQRYLANVNVNHGKDACLTQYIHNNNYSNYSKHGVCIGDTGDPMICNNMV